MRRVAAVPAGLWTALLCSAPLSAAERTAIDVTIDRAVVSTQLGESTVAAVRVANRGGTPSPPMTAHLSIVDPREGRPVDPEDWTDELARSLDPLPAGGSATLEWSLKPITEGWYAAFVSLVPTTPEAGDVPLTSPVLNLAVGPPATDPTGAVMVAVVVPAVIGGIVASQATIERRRRRR